tara:strand:+ start:114 stop:647 length:534 start_codon:yes stop_codon:yes gene_type:complete
MSELDQDFYRIGASFRRPTPGESLTNSPENQYAWEQPPVITDIREASRFFLSKLTEPKVYNAVLDSVESGTPIMDISQVLMYQAYRDGLINPDMMMILIEQVVYMIAALAERQGIDFVIQEDDEEDIEEERQEALLLAKNMPQEITEQLEATDLPERGSLLADSREEPKPVSLLGAN